MSTTERFTRRNLPHWYQPGYAHFVTYRQAGTIPLCKLRMWRADRDAQWRKGPPDGMTPAAFRERLHKQFFATYDEYLDTNPAEAVLTRPDMAEMLRENLYHHAGDKYELLAWCIMPNHVHVVLQPFEFSQAGSLSYVEQAGSLGYVEQAASLCDEPGEVGDTQSPLAGVMHSLKSYTANRANSILGRTGRFWQPESYDHWVRDLDELERIVAYVIFNPVKAGLCGRPTEWRYSSAFDRFQRDGSECGLVGWLRDDWRR